MSNSSSPAVLRDQLCALTYGPSADEFVRFSDLPVDDEVRDVVNAVVSKSPQDRDIFRSTLNNSSTDALRLFAMRRTLQSRRRASKNLVDEAMNGFALLANLDDVPWESWLKATLYIARSLGRDLDSIGERFADVASADAGARLRIALESLNRVETLSQCHISEVTTNHGIGFIETLLFRDTFRSSSWIGAPRQADNLVEFRPTTNLAQLAASLADALDASNNLVTGPIGQDQLAATSFSLTVPGAYLATTGCLSFVVDSRDEGASFTAFVAEMPDQTDVASIASAAPSEGQAIFYDAHRLILLLAQPSFDESVYVDIDFDDFGDIVRRALLDTAPSRFMPR